MPRIGDINRRDLLAAAGAAGLLGLGAIGPLSAEEAAKGQPAIKFHHIGLPTDKKHDNEQFLADAKVYITQPSADPFRIEWCRWLPESTAPEKLRTYPHLAFEVDDVEKEIAKYDPAKVFMKPSSPFEGVKVGFIEHEGFLIEFLQNTKKG